MVEPWHVDWKPVSPSTWEGSNTMLPGMVHRKVYDPLLDLTTYSTRNANGSWSQYATIREV